MLQKVFEFITTFCSIDNQGLNCSETFTKYLESKNLDYPLKISKTEMLYYCQIDFMIFPPSQVVFGLLLLSIAAVLIWDIRYNPFGEDEDGI